MKSPVSPGNDRAVSEPTRNTTPIIIPTQATAAMGERLAIMARSTPSWAEQGTASASSNVTCSRSFRLSSVRVVTVAIVSHPRPRIIGITARPFSPITRNARSSITARRGR